MADSELETGSLVSHQDTISEISHADFDEPNELASSMKIQCKFIDQSSLSREPKCSAGEISDYENKVLRDPFYESNEESDDDNTESNFHLPMASLEQFKSISLANSSNNESDEKISGRNIDTQNGKKLNTLNQGIEISNSSSASSNYYFIDASSLNDDVEVVTTNIVGYPNDFNGSLTWSSNIAQLNSSCYIPTCRANNFFLKDDSVKIANKKMGTSQNEFDEIAGIQRHLKLPEYLEPFTEVTKTRKLDSLLTADNLSILKNSNKESLVVEIKEADSGESAQHSPCPDNTNVDNSQDKTKECNSRLQRGNTHQTREEDADRKPLLIRRNTFELDANDEKLSSLRQEYERRQGSLVFQNSITQYSQHHLDGHSYFDGATEADSIMAIDLNLKSEPEIDIRNLDKCGIDNGKMRNGEQQLASYKNVETVTVGSLARSASDKLLVKYEDNDDLSFNSLPVICGEESHVPQVKSKLRRNEATPIVSGGASCSDFQKPNDSSTVKRKTETTPIVSGGSVINPILPEEEQIKGKRRTASMSSSMSAWVVDMSDCRGSNGSDKQSGLRKARDSLNPTSSSFSSAANDELSRELEREKEKPQHSSLGYFVNLESVSSSVESFKYPASKHKRRPSDLASEKNYCEFFVDLSEKPVPTTRVAQTANKAEMVSLEKLRENRENRENPGESASAVALSDSKKNIFSMFIELNDAAVQPGQVTKSSSSVSLAQKRAPEEQGDKTRPERKPKSGVFMFIESDSPLVRRRTLSSSRPAFKRHSWNTDKPTEQVPSMATEPELLKQADSSNPEKGLSRVHKRAQSLSVERPVELRRLLSQRSSSSSHLLNEIAAKEDLNPPSDYDMRDTPPNSHVELASDELLVSLRSRNYQELDAISELTAGKPALEATTQDPESCSEALENSWDKTPTENENGNGNRNENEKEKENENENENENESTDNNQTRKSETFDLISSSASGPSSGSDNLDLRINPIHHLMDVTEQRLSRSCSKVPETLRENKQKKAIRPTASASFVRLSDLDKRPVSSSVHAIPRSEEISQRSLNSNVAETSWIESKLVISARSSETIHRAVNKKFSIGIAAGPTRSDHFDDFPIEGDGEAVISESDISSLQSSMGRSGQGSTEETETSTSFAIGKPYNRLGEDLLRMFLDEINPDVTIDVAGRRIRAHKCILSSRCQYFAAILSGGWVESAGNVISLQGYSYNAVHFALCHIYSGESCIPDSISIVELATLADMLCLEGLKEVIGFTLKVKYCHLFHKPCNGCAVGVLECMPLAAAYGLDEIYRKSLRWITRHFVRIWPSKEFATLPRELMDKCYHQHVVHMSLDNVLQTIMDCDKLLTILPNVRWAEPVFRLVSNLLDASMKYLTDNFAAVLGTDTFQDLDRELTWNISRLEDHLLAAAERLPPEQACRTYSKLDKLFAAECIKSTKWSSIFLDLMNKIRGQVEKCLIRDAARAVRSNAWLKMDLELRRRIQELACLVIIPNEPPKRPSRHSNFLKEPKERQEAKLFTNRATASRNLDLRKVKMTMSEHNERTHKQTPLLQTRKMMNKPKTDPLERKLQNDKVSDMTSVLRPKSWPNKIEVKSRYLEPRNRLTVKESSVQSNQEKNISQQRKKIMISSSDSSRTSSPAMKRAAEKKALSQTCKVPVKKDGKALSSDSLAEPTCRGNLKKDIASKSCGITRPESPSLKSKETEAGLSVDSLADSKKKPLIKTARINRMDTSMSTDSLMTDITAVTTPKSVTNNKSSPTLGKSLTNSNVNQTRSYDKLKKSSPPLQQRSTPLTVRRPTRSLENSTAASRSRAAAVVSTYNGSLNLRKSLLDAAKAPDIPNKMLNTTSVTRTSLKQTSYSVKSSLASLNLNKIDKSEKKDDLLACNQRSIVSPGSKRSPKANISSRLIKSTVVSNKQKINRLDDKSSTKSRTQISNTDKDGPKFLNQSSRSGTFLKDEPTILNKSDIETAAIDV